ncbi:hypothetical protein MRX96_047303 [Rhipicephalus microplus]
MLLTNGSLADFELQRSPARQLACRLFESFAKEKNMQLKVILVGLAIFGLIVAESGAMPASSSANEAEARTEPQSAERAEQSSAEEARISEACLKSLCGSNRKELRWKFFERTSEAQETNMHLKLILVGLTIFGLIVAESGAMPASVSAQEAEARAEPESAERAEQGNAEKARISEACMASLCG